MTIEEIFEVNLAADAILSPTAHLAQWAQFIEEAQHDKIPQQATFASVHGKDVKMLNADELTLEHFLDPTLLDDAKELPLAPEIPQSVLLTGANGFLGHIVCLEWLETLSQHGGKVIAIVREQDDEAAFDKLASAFKGLDPKLEKTFFALTEHHLEVLAGDIGRPMLGLDNATFQRLASEVDRICHVAALVNHRLAYQHLFGPNVVGTSEIIRLAISHHRKPIDFISTVGVFRLLEKGNGIQEDTPFKSEIPLSDRYAAGYAISKWAGETLLRKIHEHADLPINVFRCDMILPDQRYAGQANVSDMLTRLLYSVILTGLAPQSFYQDGEKAHYHGVPVDALARAITGVHLHAHQSYKIYHAVNYLEDHISLDSFVDWIETAGYAVHRIDDHKEWVERMQTKLLALPERQRQLSALDVLMAYQHPLRGRGSRVGTVQFHALVESLNNLDSLPSLSEAYIHKYVKDMELLGMLVSEAV